MLRFEHVSLSYGSQKIIDDISFEIQEGQMAVLIGSSGCGKTTTLKMINRLIEPTSGKIYINGKDIAAQDRVELRRHIGYVIQQIGLFPNMTVAQNICVVPNLLKYSKEACDKIVHELLELVNLPYEQYAHKYPSEMSGGQQQRIGILRALAASPPIVLMDEPFSALDPMTRAHPPAGGALPPAEAEQDLCVCHPRYGGGAGPGRCDHFHGSRQDRPDGPARGDAGPPRQRPHSGFPGQVYQHALS